MKEISSFKYEMIGGFWALVAAVLSFGPAVVVAILTHADTRASMAVVVALSSLGLIGYWLWQRTIILRLNSRYVVVSWAQMKQQRDELDRKYRVATTVLEDQGFIELFRTRLNSPDLVTSGRVPDSERQDTLA